MQGNIIKNKSMSFTFERTLLICLSCKLVQVLFREYEYDLFERLSRNKFATEVERIKSIDKKKDYDVIRFLQIEVVTDDDPPEVIETLEKGQYFGDRCLIQASPHQVSLRAVTHVEMLVLSKEDLDAVLLLDESVALQIHEVAERLYPNRIPSKTN